MTTDAPDNDSTDRAIYAVIPAPVDFPVTWVEPDDASLSWSLDRMHWPGQVTPLTGEYIDIFLVNSDLVLAELGTPARMRSRRINTYHYHTMAPLPLSEHEAAEWARRGQAGLAGALGSLGERWTKEYLPEIEEHLTFWRSFDLKGATLPALLSHLGATLDRVKRLAEVHHLVQGLASVAPSLFQDLHCDLFGGDSGASDPELAFAAYRLLQGFDNRTLQAGRDLWRLSRYARAAPGVRQTLEQPATPDVISALGCTPEGREFLAELQIYLEAHGQRSDRLFELDAPAWLDDPAPVLSTLREYMTQPDHDLDRDLAAQAPERERLVAETRARLQGHPRPVVEHFDFLLRAAQVGAFLGEEHDYWIDYCMTYWVRQVMLEFGRRFVAGDALDEVDDIFYLTFNEVRGTVAESPWLDRRALVAGRRAEMAYFRTVEPPPALGAEPAANADPEDPVARADLRFWGAAPVPADRSDLLHGNGGSPGVTRGPAKVLRSLTEAGKLQKGDILVAETTAPAWTPLFAIAAAVVTDTGGALSHGAVMAREYGIPAVVGAGTATKRICDGQLLEVDGTRGAVRILK